MIRHYDSASRPQGVKTAVMCCRSGMKNVSGVWYNLLENKVGCHTHLREHTLIKRAPPPRVAPHPWWAFPNLLTCPPGEGGRGAGGVFGMRCEHHRPARLSSARLTLLERSPGVAVVAGQETCWARPLRSLTWKLCLHFHFRTATGCHETRPDSS